MNNYKTHLLLNSDIKSELLTFVNNNFNDPSFFQFNAPGRYFSLLNYISSPISKLIIDYRKRVYESFDLPSFREEPLLGNFLGVNLESACVHEHIDLSENNFYHTRINFLVCKPFGGGFPIINGQEFDIMEDESWINIASEWKHSSTPVIGDRPRIVLSLGALVEKTQLDPILKKWELINGRNINTNYC